MEGGTASVVAADEPAVDPGAAVVVDGAEVQENALFSPAGGNGEVSVVPDRRDEVGIANAGELAFGTERDGDLAVQSIRLFVPATLFAGEAEVEGRVRAPLERSAVSCIRQAASSPPCRAK